MAAIRALMFGLLLTLVVASPVRAQEEGFPLEPPHTAGPRDTLVGFLADADAGWSRWLSGEGRGQIRAVRYVDLSEVPHAERVDVGRRTAILLYDVLNRVPLPARRNVPDVAEMERGGWTRWTIPHTEITITQIQDGPRRGEWLFARNLVDHVKGYYTRTRGQPLRDQAVVADGYESFNTAAGSWFPLSFRASLPAWALPVYFDQTVWQWLGLALGFLLASVLLWLAFRFTRPRPPRKAPRPALVRPLTIIVVFRALDFLVLEQLNISDLVGDVVGVILGTATAVGACWAVVVLSRVATRAVVAWRHFEYQSLSANLVRMVSQLVAAALTFAIVVLYLRDLHVPVMGILTGLGVGGVAIALAAQGTVENFIGTMNLIADRPVSVGDVCRLDGRIGTVEALGLRSTRVRMIERSIVTIPNAEFSRMKLENLSLRDRILFDTLLSFRLDSSSEKLGALLESVRALLAGRDDVGQEDARVRLVELGPHSLDVQIYAYLLTNDFPTFLGKREELYGEILDLVERGEMILAAPGRLLYDPAVGAPPAEGGGDEEVGAVPR